jgi:hypothetical protein
LIQFSIANFPGHNNLRHPPTLRTNAKHPHWHENRTN